MDSATRPSWRRHERCRDLLGAVEHRQMNVDLAAIGGSALHRLEHRRAGGPGHAAFRSPMSRRATPCFWRWPWAGRKWPERGDIFIGVNAVDYSGYPDCRLEFIAAFETAGGPGHARRRGRRAIPHPGAAARDEQGRDHPPRHRRWAWTMARRCPATEPTTTGRACGRCDSCRLRREGFAAAGVPNPTRYVARREGKVQFGWELRDWRLSRRTGVVGQVGLEPTTNALKGRCSTD